MEKIFDLVLIGHFAQDLIIHQNNINSRQSAKSLGGGVTYGSLSGKAFNPKSKIGIISKIGSDLDIQNCKLFTEQDLDLSGVTQQGKFTTTYELNYKGHSRTIRLLNKAPNIFPKDIPNLFFNTKAIHLTPIAGELPIETLNFLADDSRFKNTVFGMDVQGLIRDFDPNGNLHYRNGGSYLEQILPTLKKFGNRLFLKASDEEAQILTHEDDLMIATRILGESGAFVFTTLGENGLLYKSPYSSTLKYDAYLPNTCLDETGAGDCFMAVFLLEFCQERAKISKDEKINQAIHLASAASSFLIEQPGPQGFQTKHLILERIKSQNPHLQIFKV